jgi:hypothetical protein
MEGIIRCTEEAANFGELQFTVHIHTALRWSAMLLDSKIFTYTVGQIRPPPPFFSFIFWHTRGHVTNDTLSCNCNTSVPVHTTSPSTNGLDLVATLLLVSEQKRRSQLATATGVGN